MKLINREVINELLKRAATAPRRRANFNLHPGPEDPVQQVVFSSFIIQ